jgi:hypothetical protein
MLIDLRGLKPADTKADALCGTGSGLAPRGVLPVG